MQEIEAIMGGGRIIVSSPDLIRRAYIASSIMRAILKAFRTGVGFGSGTETRRIFDTGPFFRDYGTFSNKNTVRLGGFPRSF